ncbi:MAG TPA: dihydroorotase [Clostridia bacterium]|nr:dihydroorotase [Clostridia bacterium]
MMLLLKGGRVIDPANDLDDIRDVLIADGKIKAVDRNIQAADAVVYDVTGKIVSPGWIDMHVHLREPGFEHKETIYTGTRAAVAGGITAVAAMPNTNPVADNQSVIAFVKDKGRQVGYAKVFPIGAITKGSQGEELAEIGDMYEAGAVAISDDGKPVMNGQLMRLAMEYARMFDLPVISHAEDLKLANDGFMHEGYVSTVLGFRGIPSVAEEAMVARDLLLAQMTDSRLHIAHVSTKGAVEMIREAKKRGIPVTAEVTPHHLTLTDEAVQSFDTSTKVNPPLRAREDQEALLQGLVDGTIDVIATDHAPHAGEEKEVEFAYAPFGLIGLETMVPLVVDRLVHQGRLTWKDAIAKVTVNPARILGLELGTLTVGQAADITVIDPEKVARVDKERFYSMARNTPFDGWDLKGWPVMTIVDGRVLMEDGRLVDTGR